MLSLLQRFGMWLLQSSRELGGVWPLWTPGPPPKQQGAVRRRGHRQGSTGELPCGRAAVASARQLGGASEARWGRPVACGARAGPEGAPWSEASVRSVSPLADSALVEVLRGRAWSGHRKICPHLPTPLPPRPWRLACHLAPAPAPAPFVCSALSGKWVGFRLFAPGRSVCKRPTGGLL